MQCFLCKKEINIYKEDAIAQMMMWPGNEGPTVYYYHVKCGEKLVPKEYRIYLKRKVYNPSQKK
jgi:hypothetical protein